MGRPSKLDNRQRAEIQRRLAIGGDGNTVTELAHEFRVGKATISRLFSKRIETVQTLATTLAETERAIETLPISESRVSATLSDLAERHTRRLAERMDEEGVLMAEELKPVVALVETANRASTIGMGLLAANKGKGSEPASTLESLITGEGA